MEIFIIISLITLTGAMYLFFREKPTSSLEANAKNMGMSTEAYKRFFIDKVEDSRYYKMDDCEIPFYFMAIVNYRELHENGEFNKPKYVGLNYDQRIDMIASDFKSKGEMR